MESRQAALRWISPDSLEGIEPNLIFAERPELRSLIFSVASQMSANLRIFSRSINISENDPLVFVLFW